MVVMNSHLEGFIWCDVDDGLIIAFDVFNVIVLMNGISWNSYGSVGWWGGD